MNSKKFEPTKPIFNVKMSSAFQDFIRELIDKNPNKNPITLVRAVEETLINNKCDENVTIKHFCTEEYNMKNVNDEQFNGTENQTENKKCKFDFKKVGKYAAVGAGGALIGVLGTIAFNHISSGKKGDVVLKAKHNNVSKSAKKSTSTTPKKAMPHHVPAAKLASQKPIVSGAK